MDARRTGDRPVVAAPPDELLVAGVVQAFAEHLLPAEEASDQAVAMAVRCYLSGASMSEACREGRRLLESQARHPSTPRVRPDRVLRAVR